LLPKVGSRTTRVAIADVAKFKPQATWPGLRRIRIAECAATYVRARRIGMTD